MSTKNITSNKEYQKIEGDLGVRSLTLDNGAKLRGGTGDNGGSGGIARECVVGYEDKWENGVQYYKEISGSIIHAVSINSTVPDSSFDITKGFHVGTTYYLANTGSIYKCTNSNQGAAVWENINSIIPKYRVFTALVTQSGGGNLEIDTISSGVLSIGVTYQIANFQAGDDFTNVGAPNNNNGTYFLATGTTPAQWGGASILQYNTAAPVAIVLENTIGNIWFTYVDTGHYRSNSNKLFTSSIAVFSGSRISRDGLHSIVTLGYDTGKFDIFSINNTGIAANQILDLTPIEIRVYN